MTDARALRARTRLRIEALEAEVTRLRLAIYGAGGWIERTAALQSEVIDLRARVRVYERVLNEGSA